MPNDETIMTNRLDFWFNEPLGGLTAALALNEASEREELAVLARRARDRGWLMRVVRNSGAELMHPLYTANFLGRSGELISGEPAREAQTAIAAGLLELSKHPSMKNV